MASVERVQDAAFAGIDYDFDLGEWIVIYEDGSWAFLEDSKDPTAQALWPIVSKFKVSKFDPLDFANDDEMQAAMDEEIERLIARADEQLYTFKPPATTQEDFKGFPATPEGRRRAEARAAEVGGEAVYDGKTDTYRVEPKEAQDIPLEEGQPIIQSRDGFDFQYNPKTGEYDKHIGRTPARDFGQMWDDMANDLWDTGDLTALATLWDQRQAVESGRLDPITLFNLVAPIADNPQHFAETWNAFATEYDNWRQQALGGQQAGFQAKGQPSTVEQQATRMGQNPAVTQALGAGYSPLQLQPPEGQIVAENGRFYDPVNHVWEDWDVFQQREAANEQSRQVAQKSQQAATQPPATTTGTQLVGTTPVQPAATAKVNSFAPTPRLPKAPAQFGGDPAAGGGFAPIPDNPMAAAFARSWNKQRQKTFVRRGPARTSFR